jgi:hypothetical protein
MIGNKDIKIRALTIRQPWAWAIAKGYKDVENRSWQTKYKGLFLIHAAMRCDPDGLPFLKKILPQEVIKDKSPDDFPSGGFVGFAKIDDCVTYHGSQFFTGPFGFVIKEPYQFPLIPFRGDQGLFKVSLSELMKAIYKKCQELNQDNENMFNGIIAFFEGIKGQ